MFVSPTSPPHRRSGPTLRAIGRPRRYHARASRFLQADPIGYGDGMNLYAYGSGDPVNGLDPSGTAWWPSRLELKRADGGGGFTWGSSSGGSSGGGRFDADGNARFASSGDTSHTILACVARCSAPAGHHDADGTIHVFAPPQLRWVSAYSGSIDVDIGRSLAWTFNFARVRQSVIGSVIGTLDQLAAWLEPPAPRQADESYWGCVNRIAAGSPAQVAVGAGGVAAGGPWLRYPRGGLAGGGRGTSLISAAARGTIGFSPMGRGIFGTGSASGALGRGLSTFSVATGAPMAGWGAGTFIGALDRCQ